MNTTCLRLACCLAVLFAVAVPVLEAAPENKTRPTTFVGIPWGTASSEALRIMSSRSGVSIPDPVPTGEKIELTGGVFAGQPAERWILEFADGKLFAATVQLKPAEKTAAALYRELKQVLIGKYGPVSGERKPGSSIGDRRERRINNPTAKTLGMVASWRFGETISDKQRLSLELELAAPAGVVVTEEAQLALSVRYINETLRPARTEAVAEDKPEVPSKGIKAEDL